MSWLKEVIGTEKAVIAMCHLRALPGDPSFDAQLGMNWVIDKAWDDRKRQRSTVLTLIYW